MIQLIALISENVPALSNLKVKLSKSVSLCIFQYTFRS